MKQNVLAKGYVCPYDVGSYYVLAGILASCHIGLAIYLATVSIPVTVGCLVIAALCFLIPLLGLVFNRAAMRYSLTDTHVQSRNLFGTCCRLEDHEVKQIELQYSFEVWKSFVDMNAVHLVCSDAYYRQVPYISRKYHRKKQVVIRVTCKNFPAVQAYLARMGVPMTFSNFDAMMQMLKPRQLTWREKDGTWSMQ